MASFNVEGLKKKLRDLNSSSQSIQTLSLWLIHHKKHANTVVTVWHQELVKASESRKLVFMYLANDVIQNSKKKGPDYNKEFASQLPKVFEHLSSVNLDDKAVKGISRLLEVWGERGVFSQDILKTLQKPVEIKFGISPVKPQKTTPKPNNKENKAAKKRRSSKSHEEPPEEAEERKRIRSVLESPPTQTVTTEELFAASPEPQPKTPVINPPKPEELIEALQDLENAATADADVREKISNLPKEVSDASCLDTLEDAQAGRELMKEVEAALTMLEAYNKRLSEEMEARKGVARTLRDYISYQKDLLSQAEETLELNRQKLNKVQKVENELRAHLQNLPDISKLPNIKTGGLAPLPSAGDLFT